MRVDSVLSRGALIVTVLLAVAGCAQMLPGPSSTSSTSELVAEIDRVDPGARQIVLRTTDGRLETVSYDDRTQVMYRGQVYPVTALERGDLVSTRVGSAGYVDSISVQQSVQERRGATGPGPVGPAGPTGPSAGSLSSQRIEGTVGMIDAQRGVFEVRTPDLGTLLVSLPYNPRRTDMERFQHLRSGETVRVSGRMLNAQRFELEQFL